MTQHTKAIAAFIAGLLVTPLTFLGISPETPIEAALTIIINALIIAVSVWYSPRND